MRGEGVFAEQIASLFDVARRRAGLDTGGPPLSTDSFRRPPSVEDRPQIGLFE
jgi:hypothetical protein